MARHTKYMQAMLRDLENGQDIVKSPDGLVEITHTNEKICGKMAMCIKVYHYGTHILSIYDIPCGRHIEGDGWSFTIGEGAYSPTDARIINQVLEKYIPGIVAHSRKGEVIVD